MDATVNTSSSATEAECKSKDTATLPLSETRLVCIEYPGLVNNVDRMLETIGGEQGLSKVIIYSYCLNFKMLSLASVVCNFLKII